MNTKAPTIFSEYMIREHSLFYAYVWNKANRDLFDEFVPGANVKNILFIRNKVGVLEVYYDLAELDAISDDIANAITGSPALLDAIISRFYEHWKNLLPYLEGRQKIGGIDELKKFYQDWTAWWVPMAHIFMIPDNERASQELRQKALKVRQDTQEYSDAADKIVMNYISEKYPQYKDIAGLLTPDEVYVIETLSDIQIAEVEKRSEGFALLTLYGTTMLISLPELKKQANVKNFTLKSESVPKEIISEIKGSPASSGIVTGPVRLILSKSDLAFIQPGDIMVTYATSPDYVPAMEKCAAIVTDEGGVVCHAAIVARELKMPCIVGTKIGTKILKDGDRVEVDADKGIVKIIK